LPERKIEENKNLMRPYNPYMDLSI